METSAEPAAPAVPALLRRVVYERDWANLADEHAGGALQIGFLVWLLLAVLGRGLEEVRQRALASTPPDWDFLRTIASIDSWFNRISTVALLAMVGAASMKLVVLWAAQRRSQIGLD